MKSYKDIDSQILKKIPNNIYKAYFKNKHICPELTFLGSPNQRDYAKITITIVYSDSLIELKSLKEYFYQYSDIHISYERLGERILQDIDKVYAPKFIKIKLETNPRGGISSKIVFKRP